MTNMTCPWTVFDDREKDDVDRALDLAGAFTCVVTLWFILAYFFTSLKENPSYKNIAAFLATGWIRRATPVIVNNIFIDKKSEFWKDTPILEIFGFAETFMAVHEIECLSHVCVERFVVSRYIYNEWIMPRKHYVMFRRLCLGFATVYSLAPFLGIGGYGFDFTCSSYTMDMTLSTTKWREAAALFLFSVKGVKPAAFMIYMLVGAQMYVHRFTNSEYDVLQRKISRRLPTEGTPDLKDDADIERERRVHPDAAVMTFVNLVCWTPIAMIRGKVVVKQPQYGTEMLYLPSAYYIKLALLLHWISLLPTVIALFVFDRNIQDATLKLRFRHILGKGDASKDE